MPIKPEHRGRYPADWEERRARVLKRAGHRCELCGAPNRDIISRNKQTPAWWIRWPLWGAVSRHRHNWRKPIKIILTVAHLDRDYKDHDEKFLLALCQRCHLKIDAHQRAVERRMTPAEKVVKMLDEGEIIFTQGESDK